jgi:O-methyltransferase
MTKSAIRAAGYELRRTAQLPTRAPGITHAEVFPNATYSPWLADQEFQKTYELIRNNTLVDQYRCYELWHLVAQVAKLKTGDVLEVGVWRGGTGALVAKRCELLGMDATVYLCDTFRGVVKAGSGDGTYVGGEHADTTKETVLELCRTLDLGRVRVLEGIFPDETGHEVSARIRFCHIDVDVYESARAITEWVWPRLEIGGIIVYDDYGFHECTGITRFVNEECLKTDRVVTHNLNGHALVIKIGDAATLRKGGEVL